MKISITLTADTIEEGKVLNEALDTIADKLSAAGVELGTGKTADAAEPAPAAAKGKGKKGAKKAAAAPVEEEEEVEAAEEAEEEEFDLGGGDDEEEEEAGEEEEPAMSFDEFRKKLKAVGKPEAVTKLLKTKYKIANLKSLDASKYEEVLKAVKKLK